MPVVTQTKQLIFICSLLILSACGEKKADASHKADTQVVAKVNGKEISIHQINFQLSRLGSLDEKQTKLAANKILAQLVEQEMLKQKALEANLDRDPNVMQVIEASKVQILAQAYLEQAMAKAAKPSTTEVDTFYKEHPELFEARRIFRLQELSVSVQQDKFDEIENSLKAISGINQVAEWLRNHNFPFTANSNVRAPEQLPLDLVKKIQPLKDGDFIVVKTPRTLNIVHLAASQSAPITRDKAGPVIEQYFMNQNKAKLAKSEMESLQSKAHIEYLGEFADLNHHQKANTATSAEPPAVTTTKQEIALPKEASSDASMDKGLSGL